MSLKSITTFLHDPAAEQSALEYAIQAARKWDAHLHFVIAGVNRIDPNFYYAGAQAIAIQTNFDEASSDAVKLEALVRDRLHAEDINWDVETVSLMASGIEMFLGYHMRFFDMAILPLPYAEGRSHVDVSAFEACIFGASLPVIAVPNGFSGSAPDKRILVAWDDGPEAMSAARSARPIAGSVDLTEVCVIHPTRGGMDQSNPGERIAQFLVRSGAKVDLTVVPKMQSDVATQLSRRANETAAELIVMGAYGHSRLHEAVLGGVTRSMLRDAAVPVLMAH